MLIFAQQAVIVYFYNYLFHPDMVIASFITLPHVTANLPLKSVATKPDRQCCYIFAYFS